MEAGAWYKRFGAEEARHDTLETYYHVVEVRDRRLYVNEYNFYSHLEKLIQVNQSPYKFGEKEWMEEIIKNNIYLIKKEALPFYLIM